MPDRIALLHVSAGYVALRRLTVGSVLLAVVAVNSAATALAQVPPKITPVTKIPKLPSLNLPTLTQVLVMDTPNFSTPNPFSLAPGQQARVRAQLSATVGANMGVQLRYTAGVLTGPASITIPPNTLFMDFQVTALPTNTQATGSVKGWTIDSTQTKLAVLSVVPITACTHPTPTLHSSVQAVPGNSSVTIVAVLSCAPTVATQVQVTSSAPGTIPSPPGGVLTVPAGVTAAQYTTITGNVQSTTVVTFTGFLPNTNPIVRAPDLQIAVTKP